MGDTNCDIMKKPFEGSTKTYNQINNIYCLKHVNDSLHTRVTNRSRTLVDHMLTNYPDKVKSHGIILNGMSDHYISYLAWVSKQPCENTSETYVTYRK